MKKKLKVSFILFSLLIFVITPNVVYALTITNASATIDCNQSCLGAGTTFTYDRDNTGSNLESNGIIIRDGAGTVLYTDGGTSPVGGSNTLASDVCFTYSTAPQVNPITLQLVSPAGNGLLEQIAYSTTGTCQISIPTMTQWGMIVFMLLAGIGSVYYLRRKRIES